MADMLAWSVNAQYKGFIHGGWRYHLLNVKREKMWLDEQTMMNPDPNRLEEFLASSLQTRRRISWTSAPIVA